MPTAPIFILTIPLAFDRFELCSLYKEGWCIMAKKISVSQAVYESIKQRSDNIKNRLKALRLDETYISPKVPPRLTFKVELISNWAHEGEKSVVLTGSKSIGKILESAVQEFHRINNRKDFQFRWSVKVILPSGVEVPIPEEVWVGIKNKIKDGD